MWKRAGRSLMKASVAMNVAFVGMWIAYAATSRQRPRPSVEATTRQQAIWCPLHRKLDVTEEQWARIEPRLAEFQAAVAELRQRFQAIRPEVIDLIAAEDSNLEAIRAKQDEILATKRKIQGLMANHLIAEKQVLTPDQQSQLFKMLRKQSDCRAGPPMSGQGIEPDTGESGTGGPGTGQVLGDPREGANAGGSR